MTTHGAAGQGASHSAGSHSAGSHGAAPEIVIITGMSGAGRSTAAKSLEDLDWFVADNLPPALLVTMLDLARRARAEVPRVAAVVDIRSRAFSTDMQSSITELDAIGAHPFVVFLEAGDETLVRRFENVRRPHPLQENGRVIDGIKAEREQLQRDQGARGPDHRHDGAEHPRAALAGQGGVRQRERHGGPGERALVRLQVRPASRCRHGG